jgi:monoamine oxidase
MTEVMQEFHPRQNLSHPQETPTNKTNKKRVVIIGGGFAGIAAARALWRIETNFCPKIARGRVTRFNTIARRSSSGTHPRSGANDN